MRVVESKSPNDAAQVRLRLACKCKCAAAAADTERQPREPNSTVKGCEGTYNPNGKDETQVAMQNIVIWIPRTDQRNADDGGSSVSVDELECVSRPCVVSRAAMRTAANGDREPARGVSQRGENDGGLARLARLEAGEQFARDNEPRTRFVANRMLGVDGGSAGNVYSLENDELRRVGGVL